MTFNTNALPDVSVTRKFWSYSAGQRSALTSRPYRSRTSRTASSSEIDGTVCNSCIESLSRRRIMQASGPGSVCDPRACTGSSAAVRLQQQQDVTRSRPTEVSRILSVPVQRIIVLVDRRLPGQSFGVPHQPQRHVAGLGIEPVPPKSRHAKVRLVEPDGATPVSRDRREPRVIRSQRRERHERIELAWVAKYPRHGIRLLLGRSARPQRDPTLRAKSLHEAVTGQLDVKEVAELLVEEALLDLRLHRCGAARP